MLLSLLSIQQHKGRKELFHKLVEPGSLYAESLLEVAACDECNPDTADLLDGIDFRDKVELTLDPDLLIQITRLSKIWSWPLSNSQNNYTNRLFEVFGWMCIDLVGSLGFEQASRVLSHAAGGPKKSSGLIKRSRIVIKIDSTLLYVLRRILTECPWAGTVESTRLSRFFEALGWAGVLWQIQYSDRFEEHLRRVVIDFNSADPEDQGTELDLILSSIGSN